MHTRATRGWIIKLCVENSGMGRRLTLNKPDFEAARGKCKGMASCTSNNNKFCRTCFRACYHECTLCKPFSLRTRQQKGYKRPNAARPLPMCGGVASARRNFRSSTGRIATPRSPKAPKPKCSRSRAQLLKWGGGNNRDRQSLGSET